MKKQIKKLAVWGALVVMLAVSIFLIAGCTESTILPPGTPLFESNFNFGISVTHYRWDTGAAHAAARDRAMALLRELNPHQPLIHNIHIMGWGSPNPWPSRDAPMDFSGIRTRVNLALSLGHEPWITLCTAPGWMKSLNHNPTHQHPDNADWWMDNAPLPQFEDDFARLSAEIARAFPEVRVFQVWNEFKGMWSGGNLDRTRYVRLYNKVYNAIRAVRPDAVIGGFYAVVEGDGTWELFSHLPQIENNRRTVVPLSDDVRTALEYFLARAVGVDKVLFSQLNVHFHNCGYWPGFENTRFRATADQAMMLTRNFRRVAEQAAQMTSARGMPNLPIVFAEYYGTYGDNNADAPFMPINNQFIAAHYSSIIYNMIMGAGGRDLYALLWIERDDIIRHALFTDTRTSTGGQPTPHFHAMRKLLEYFPPGTMLYSAELTSPGVQQSRIGDVVEALVSDRVAFVINKTNRNLSITLNGREHILSPYAVEVFYH